ncbi:integral membrane protein S linking to the trans Golgi network-domain-containing protein [Lipomyces oligophaga]|uniref:integral membrane protein S linking to the trans Golgi network-domain-containing protein n=1 Tax=Lipomyces oligophaga TaxID=45792 RepID=UPI0034CF6FCE
MSFRERRRRRPVSSRAANRFDSYAPKRLAVQIVVLQSIYYVSVACLILFTCLVSGTRFSGSLVFSWSSIRIDTTVGWTLSFIWFLAGLLNVLPLAFFVGRSKLVPDFVLTLHGINLFVTCVFTRSFPSSVLWWILQFASISIMLFLGTWASRHRELNVLYFPPLKISSSTSASSSTALPGVSSDSTSNSVIEEFELIDRVDLRRSDERPTSSKSSNSARSLV